MKILIIIILVFLLLGRTFINKNEAESLAKSLIQKNIDDFYHRAWVITKN